VAKEEKEEKTKKRFYERERERIGVCVGARKKRRARN
jgi:hypothetical protein